MDRIIERLRDYDCVACSSKGGLSTCHRCSLKVKILDHLDETNQLKYALEDPLLGKDIEEAMVYSNRVGLNLPETLTRVYVVLLWK